MNAELQSHNENFKIRKEASAFLQLQIFGNCPQEYSQFTKVSLTNKAKQILKPVLNMIYFRDQDNNLRSHNITEIYKILSKLKIKVSLPDISLIHYIDLIISGHKESSKFNLLDEYSKA